MTPATRDAILTRMWLCGESVQDIAAATGLPYGSVCPRSAVLNLPSRMGVDGREAVGIGDDPLLRKLNEVHPR